MKNKAFVIVGVIVTLLAGILNGQTPVEIRAASSSAVSGWRRCRRQPVMRSGWRRPPADVGGHRARRGAHASDGGPAVAIVLTDEGAKKMAELSGSQTNKPIALMLDGQVIWAPIVRGSIGKEAVLTGGQGGLTQSADRSPDRVVQAVVKLFNDRSTYVRRTCYGVLRSTEAARTFGRPFSSDPRNLRS